ncbi:MAG: YkgJ family cysteine cluster protein [Arcobacteraceae bacterium]
MSNIIKKDGFDFVFDASLCSSCNGNCCIGESGYIWISKDEIEKLANFLKLDVQEFTLKYLYKVGYKYSIKEVEAAVDNFACAFFDLEKKQCSVYEFRPIQCRTFPFWEYFKTNKEEVQKECLAVQSI